MADTSKTYYFKNIGIGVGIFLVCLVTVWIGLEIRPINAFTIPLWPPMGIALASFVLYGYRFWPVVALAEFIASIWIGAPLWVALGITLGNTAGPLAGACLLKKYVGFDPRILNLRGNINIFLTAISVSVISATIGLASLLLGGKIADGMASDTLLTWWMGDVLGILIFAPLIFAWIKPRQINRTGLQYVELFAVLAAVSGTSLIIFWVLPPHAIAYYLFIPLTWAALRTGSRGTTLSLLFAAVIAISGTFFGHGPFAEQGLVFGQIFLDTTAGFFLIFSAIVEERKRALIGVRRHVDELKISLHKVSTEDEAKKDFLAILSHELRNPLAAILSSVELLRLKESHTPDTAELLRTIDEHVHAMTKMLDDLLDVARISRNKLTLRKEILSLDSVIDRSVRTAQSLIRSRGHTLSVIKPDHELFLEADPIRLEQILVNILNNAAKYTNPNGSIELAARKKDGMAVICVRDSGVGIPQNMLDRIFEPFFQVERGKLATEGLGVGLQLTRQLVEMHHGSIEAASQGEGHGSEFTVSLPLPAQTPIPPSAAPRRVDGRPLRPTKYARSILVVDDNEVAAESLGRLLELRGHNVKIAHNGSEAIDAARQFRPEIIILDIGLPDIDGYEVVRILKGQKGFSPAFIALTGYGQTQDKERALQAGFHLHLTKPVNLMEIEAALRKVLHASGHE